MTKPGLPARFLHPMKWLSALFLSAVLPLTAAELPLLIAHRGASHAAPENTLSAFKLAWEEGADGIEGDFYLSSDGEIVCIHDADTKRTAGEKLVVAKTPWSKLSTLDVGSWKDPRYAGEKIPRLGDVLDVLPPGKKFFIEIKSGPGIVEPIAKILAEKKADPSQVVLISFDDEVIRACREKLPAYEVHWISSLKEFDQGSNAELYAKRLEATGANGFQFQATSPVTSDWLAALRRKNLPLTSWTVNDAALARRMIGYGVSHITTDRPGPLRAELLAE